MLSFFDRHMVIYNDYLEGMGNILRRTDYSIYLRGSANKKTSNIKHKPWDIDLVLVFNDFLIKDTELKVKEFTLEFNNFISKLNYPYVDVSFMSSFENDVDKYILYILNQDAYLLKGMGSKYVKEAARPNKNELKNVYNFYLSSAFKKLIYLSCMEKTNTADYYYSKITNLVKTIARCGCILLLIHSGEFTRDVNSGLEALEVYFCSDVFNKIKLPLIDLNCIDVIHIILFKMTNFKGD